VGFFDRVFGVLFSPVPEALEEVTPGRRALIDGRVVGRDLLTSPIAELPCVYYHSTIEEWREGNAFLGGAWHLVEHDEAIAEFYVKSGAERALVSPFRARVTPTKLREHRFVSLGGNLRAQEFVLCPGDRIEVQGLADVVADIHDESRFYRDPVRRLMLQAPKNAELSIRLIERSRRRAAVTSSFTS
jgi:hypothetical protein